MAITSSKKKIRIKYSPLKVSCKINIVSTIAPRQTCKEYDGVLEYTPDFSLTPLVLEPICTASDEDSQSSYPVNSYLTSMSWYERIGSKETLITSGSGYEITLSGDNKGRIKVKKNGTPSAPISLRFSAEFVDSRSGDVYKFTDSILIQCINESESNPQLKIDNPASDAWNPLKDSRETRTKTLTATLMRGDKDVTESSGVSFFWYRMDLGASTPREVRITGNADGDGDIVSMDGNQLTVNLDNISSYEGGKRVDRATYVCRAGFSASGTAPTSPSSNIAPKTTTIKRYIPALECDFSSTTDVPMNAKKISPKAIVADNQEVLEDDVVNRDLRCKWYKHGNNTSTMSKVAEGINPTIPITADMVVNLEIEDRGNNVMLVDASGRVLVDASGRVIITRNN